VAAPRLLEAGGDQEETAAWGTPSTLYRKLWFSARRNRYGFCTLGPPCLKALFLLLTCCTQEVGEGFARILAHSGPGFAERCGRDVGRTLSGEFTYDGR
jgi:hypothetical protein